MIITLGEADNLPCHKASVNSFGIPAWMEGAPMDRVNELNQSGFDKVSMAILGGVHHPGETRHGIIVASI